VSELDGLRDVLDRLSQTGEALKGLQVFRRRTELVLRLPEGLLFDVGDARVEEARLQMLKTLAPELTSRTVDVRVEGHTDDRPISSGRYHSNWDLSTARATAVMAILLQEGMLPERLSVAGYAEFHPVASNATEDGRRQNRRVDLVVTAAVPEESPAPAEPTEPVAQ
jgi:chemotaxis protein MotB